MVEDKEIVNTIDRMVNLGILSKDGSLFSLSKKFKDKIVINWTSDPSLSFDEVQVLSFFDFSDVLNAEEITLFNSVIDTLKN